MYMSAPPAKYLDKETYKKAKAEIDKEYKKTSAYKSLALVKKYKSMGGRVDEKRSKGGLKTWIQEDWRNLTPYATGKVKSIKATPKCGQKAEGQKLPSVCRPLKSKTISTAQEFTREQVRKAVDIKKKGGRIIWSKL